MSNADDEVIYEADDFAGSLVKRFEDGEPLGVELSAKESAFMSKELAKIVTDIPAIQSVSLEDVKLNINQELLKQRLLDLEIKSLIV